MLKQLTQNFKEKTKNGNRTYSVGPERLTRQDIEMNETVFMYAFLCDSDAGKAYASGVIDQGERPWSIDADICSHRLKMGGLGISS